VIVRCSSVPYSGVKNSAVPDVELA